MANSEGFTLGKIGDLDLKLIGKLDNGWRQRRVDVYAHPTDKDKVVSVGHPYAGGEPIICVEEREDYSRTIHMFPKTHSWS